ncbi:hypothetical protein XFACTOR_74 [Mycobacterium phage XFactor]|uniref:Uncharacterized protein n=1 Tax=Mycobacterium phage XFactor TaxID=1698715 RepID=A0A0K2FNQ1_9CAUD|nr:hypothetical protein XFACTOR_74 [Mycobacterium phage XFactor]ALA48822.1 hypothetical protein XFACTOR_74 [Mycobacterium phage XFactor]
MNNPELRAVLTEALSRSYYRIVGGSSDCRVDPGEILADALLSLPGVAVIQLPEATHSGTVSTSFRRATAWRKIPQVRGENRLVTLDDPGRCMNPDEARILAADLLAAAAVVAAGEEHHG